ncbi:MAG TPA: glycosyltransferase family 1 protein [Patescibacteria group bacterium]|nr:glycosyltransferase family 1 protein [Patescibacteria group bacterium]
MIIGIDGNEANIKNRVGVNKYAYEVIKGIYNLLPKNEDLIVVVYLKDRPFSDMPKESKNFKYKVLSSRKMWILTRLTPYLLKNSDRLDVFFSPNHYLPPLIPIPSVCSVMDLGFFEFSAQFTKYDFWQLKYWTAISVNRSKYVLTISEASKKDIIKYYKKPSEGIVVTYPGVDDLTKTQISDAKIANIKGKYSIVNDYILYLGTLKPSKNIESLITAFSEIKNDNLQLVIAGKKGWLYESIFSLVKNLNLERKVVFTDFIDEKDKFALIKGAKMFVLPSFWEGFGLDILTAFSLNVPVVASNVGSLPEVVGNAGFLINPNNINSIANGMEKVLKMTKKEYNNLIEKEKVQLGKFSWINMSKKTIEVLRKAAN